jgi:hypothetical protein
MRRMMLRRQIDTHPLVAIQIALLGLIVLMLTSCAHAPLAEPSLPAAIQPDLPSPIVLETHAMVVGRHPAAVAQAREDLQRLGFTLIARDRLQLILDEQDPHLLNPLAAQTYLARKSALSGAEVLVLVDVENSKDTPSVIVKGIDVETGTILWSAGIVATQGTSAEEYNRVVIDLTHRAVLDGFTKPQGGSTAVLFSHP